MNKTEPSPITVEAKMSIFKKLLLKINTEDKNEMVSRSDAKAGKKLATSQSQ